MGLTGRTISDRCRPGSNSNEVVRPKPPRCVMVKALDCGIVVSKFELQSHHSLSDKSPWGERYEHPLSTQLWVKQYHYSSSRRMALALNNPRKLICQV